MFNFPEYIKFWNTEMRFETENKDGTASYWRYNWAWGITLNKEDIEKGVFVNWEKIEKITLTEYVIGEGFKLKITIEKKVDFIREAYDQFNKKREIVSFSLTEKNQDTFSAENLKNWINKIYNFFAKKI